MTESSAPIRVLIVEDSRNIMTLMRDHLQLEGFETYCAENGTDALALARETPPDVAVVDIGLPDISGWDVCRGLRKDGRTQAVPIVVFTAESSGHVKEEMEQLRLSRYVKKPFDPILMSGILKELARPGGKA